MNHPLKAATLCLTLAIGGMAAPSLAQTNALLERAQALQAEQQAPHFQIGGTTYQLIPEAIVRPSGDEPAHEVNDNQASSRLRSVDTPQALAYIGPYAITLGDASNRQSRTRSVQADSTSGYRVVMNMRTGQPTLMLPQLQLQVREAGHGQALAQALGGKLLHDGPDSLLVIVTFDDVESALRALPQARAMDNVIHAQPTLQRRFRKLR